jgi:hypothetical protein
MKKLVILTLCLLFALAMVAGCGQQEAEEAEDTSAVGAPEEVMDTTRMDSAAAEAAEAVEDTLTVEEGEGEATE